MCHHNNIQSLKKNHQKNPQLTRSLSRLRNLYLDTSNCPYLSALSAEATLDLSAETTLGLAADIEVLNLPLTGDLVLIGVWGGGLGFTGDTLLALEPAAVEVSGGAGGGARILDRVMRCGGGGGGAGCLGESGLGGETSLHSWVSLGDGSTCR